MKNKHPTFHSITCRLSVLHDAKSTSPLSLPAFHPFRFFSPRLCSTVHLAISLYTFAHAQEPALYTPEQPPEKRVRTLGKIADGSPSSPAPPAVIPHFTIKQSFTKESLHSAASSPQATFHEVEDPQLPAIEPPITSRTMTQEEWDAYRQSPQYAALSATIARRKKMQIIMLSATIYDNRRTHLRWWHKDRMHEAWSNINFLHLSGFSSFAKDDQEYVLFMAASNTDTAARQKHAMSHGKKWYAPAIPALSDSAETEPTFTLIGEMPPEEAIEPITALHELYSHEHAQLKAAHEARSRAEIAKAEELRLNPPKPQIPKIYFWRGKRDASETPAPTTKQP